MLLPILVSTGLYAGAANYIVVLKEKDPQAAAASSSLSSLLSKEEYALHLIQTAYDETSSLSGTQQSPSSQGIITSNQLLCLSGWKTN